MLHIKELSIMGFYKNSNKDITDIKRLFSNCEEKSNMITLPTNSETVETKLNPLTISIDISYTYYDKGTSHIAKHTIPLIQDSMISIFQNLKDVCSIKDLYITSTMIYNFRKERNESVCEIAFLLHDGPKNLLKSDLRRNSLYLGCIYEITVNAQHEISIKTDKLHLKDYKNVKNYTGGRLEIFPVK